MALAQVYKLIYQYRVQDKLCSWGIHYECTAGTSPDTDASDLIMGWTIANGMQALGCLADDVTFEGLYVSCVVPATALPGRFNGQSTPGTDSGSSAPANLCTVLTLQTENDTAIRHGRIYFSGISKNRLSDGIWTAAFIAGPLTAFTTDLALNITEGGKTFRPCFVQRIANGVPVGPVIMPLSAIRMTQIPYTQRRRTTKQYGSGPV